MSEAQTPQTLLERIESLERSLAKIEHAKTAHRSIDIDQLASALAKAQGSFKVAGAGSINPYFKNKYETLTDVVEASRESLAANGLAVIQRLEPNEDGQLLLYTMLTHSSGQWISSVVRIVPSKSDVQSFASYVIYMRRQAYAALVGVVAHAEDDDAELAVHADRAVVAKGVALNTKYNPKEQPYETITKEQLDELEYELAEYPDIGEQILEGLKLQSLADMPRSKFMISARRIREIKNLRNGIK